MKKGLAEKTFTFFLFFFSLNIYAFELDAAQIENLKGLVFITAPDGKTRQAVKGATVFSDEIVETKANSEAVIIFDDGSRIEIKPETRIKINDPMTEGETSVMLFIGRIFTHILHRVSDEPIFSVQSITTTAGVRGTDFEVASGMDGTALVGVEDGEVEISTDGKEMMLAKGEEVEVSTEGVVKRGKRRLRTEQEWQDWFKQREQFFINHSDEVIEHLSQRVEQAQAKIKEQDQKVAELKKELADSAEKGKLNYFQVRRKVREQIRVYSKMLNNLSKLNNKMVAMNQIIAKAEEEIKENPGLYSSEFIDQIKSARGKLDKMDIQSIYLENRKLIIGHWIGLAKTAKKFNLESELFRNLPPKTKQKILKKLSEQKQMMQKPKP